MGGDVGGELEKDNGIFHVGLTLYMCVRACAIVVVQPGRVDLIKGTTTSRTCDLFTLGWGRLDL